MQFQPVSMTWLSRFKQDNQMNIKNTWKGHGYNEKSNQLPPREQSTVGIWKYRDSRTPKYTILTKVTTRLMSKNWIA